MQVPVLVCLIVSLGSVSLARAQDNSPFQTQLMKALQGHAFFREVTFGVEAGRPPFLFFLQASLKQDEKNYDRLIINPILPFLKELVSLFDATYCKPQGIVLRPGAEQFAIAVLSSRGLYDDYARATKDASLHMSLAHYNPDLRLAVTYRAGFGTGSPKEERQSLLHEVVHALQHSYSSTDQLPKPVWFKEGQAEYMSSSDHMPESLRNPPLLPDHVAAMIYAHGHPEGRKLLLPIADLVLPETYEQVIEMITKHAGKRIGAQDALPMFYAQSEMTVRFLCEGQDRKYRDGFLRYFKAVEAGASGLATFQEAFGTKTPEAMVAMTREWQAWIGVVLAQHLGFAVDARTGKGLERAALPPPIAFDRAPLAWQDTELDARLAGVRRVCSLGEYARALTMLPVKAEGAAAAAALQRERKRVQALVDLRDRVVADLQKRGTVDVAGNRGKFVRGEGDDVVLLQKQGESRIRLAPNVLLALAGSKGLKAFENADSWLEVWLLWLNGERRAKLASSLEKKWSMMEDLRTDLTVDLDSQYGTAAVALEQFQNQPLPEDRQAAREAIGRLTEYTSTQNPLFLSRKAAIEQLTRALAERAFALDDAVALGIHADVRPLPDGRVRIDYTNPATAPTADFALAPDESLQFIERAGIAYTGPTCVQPDGDHWSAIGCGFLHWAMPVIGPHEIEFEYQFASQQGSLSLIFCHVPGRHLNALADGRLQIDDLGVIRDETGAPRKVAIDQPHHLKVVHDGVKTATAYLDGQKTAELQSVGSCLDGSIVLAIRSSTPVHIRKLTIIGKLDPTDPAGIRERYVARAIEQLWQHERKAGALPAPNATPPGEDQPAFAWRRSRKVVEAQAATAINAALTWLVRHQDPDGRWDVDAFMKHDTAGQAADGPGNPTHDVAVTALAVLALLAEGNTTRKGPYNANVRRAIDWLVDQQNMTSGMFAVTPGGRAIYDHAMATIAVAEAAGISGDARLLQAAQTGIDYLAQHRAPYGVWGYEPRAAEGTTSVTVWCLQALCTGRVVGLRVDEAALKATVLWFDGVTDADGITGYTRVGDAMRYSSDHAMRFPVEKVRTLTAASLFGRYLLGQKPSDVAVMAKAADVILRKPPVWDVRGGGIDECYWYFATHALHLHGGKPAADCRRQLVDTLVKAQRVDGNFAGSWDPVGAWSQDGGRVCTTALLVLSLQAPYRYNRP